MEEKEVKIQVPEGYEIDKENSTFECIKFKRKNISYEEILSVVFNEVDTLTKEDLSRLIQEAIKYNTDKVIYK